jgi:hypothetical protein
LQLDADQRESRPFFYKPTAANYQRGHAATLPSDDVCEARMNAAALATVCCRCASPLLTIAAALGHGRPMWVNPPPDKRAEAAAARQALAPQVRQPGQWAQSSSRWLNRVAQQPTVAALFSCVTLHTRDLLCSRSVAQYRHTFAPQSPSYCTAHQPSLPPANNAPVQHTTRCTLTSCLLHCRCRRTASAATTWQQWQLTTAGWQHAQQAAGALQQSLRGSTLCLNRCAAADAGTAVCTCAQHAVLVIIQWMDRQRWQRRAHAARKCRHAQYV